MEDDISAFLSSYGVMTAERILGRYSLSLPSQDVMTALKNSRSFYNQLLKVPFKHVLNGIIIQQTYDYYVFAQKLFVDYLLSGESGKEAGSPGGNTREDLESERKKLLELGERYQDIQTEQDKKIAESQAWLIQFAKGFQVIKNQCMENYLAATGKDRAKIESAFTQTLIHGDYKQFIPRFAEAAGCGNDKNARGMLAESWEAMTTQLNMLDTQLDGFLYQAKEMAKKAMNLRKQFYELLLRVRAMITQLPEYSHNAEQERKNKEALYFDSSIGDWI